MQRGRDSIVNLGGRGGGTTRSLVCDTEDGSLQIHTHIHSPFNTVLFGMELLVCWTTWLSAVYI